MATARAEAFRSCAARFPRPTGPGPRSRSSPNNPALWLRYDGTPANLPLHMVVHPRAVTHETNLNLQVGRRGVDGRQETEFAVHFGTLEYVDVDVPPELVNRWEVENGDVASRTDLGPTTRGGRRFPEICRGGDRIAPSWRSGFGVPWRRSSSPTGGPGGRCFLLRFPGRHGTGTSARCLGFGDQDGDDARRLATAPPEMTRLRRGDAAAAVSAHELQGGGGHATAPSHRHGLDVDPLPLVDRHPPLAADGHRA